MRSWSPCGRALKRALVRRLVVPLVILASLTLPPSSSPDAAVLSQNYGRLPMAFEPNVGQAETGVDFLARGSGYGVFLRSADAVLVLAPPTRAVAARGRLGSPPPSPDTPPAILHMRLVGSRAGVQAAGVQRLPGKSHYLIGRDPGAWRRDVPTYARVRYDDVYPGVSIIYYGNQQQLEYDFIVAPGADPGAIELAFDGARDVRVDASGDVVLATEGGTVRLRRPTIYQDGPGGGPVAGGYVMARPGHVRFAVARYDAARPLVIDPVLSYSSYLGGASDDEGFGIAVDATGSAYVTGTTISADFPTIGARQPLKDGVGDAFVAKIDPSGGSLVYSTYFGGNDTDAGNAIAVDSTGNAYVAGSTASNDFPLVNAFQSISRGNDAFLAKLDPTGATLVYSTLLGGSLDDFAFGVAVDPAGNAYVTGATQSADFPTVSALRATKGAASDAFIAKFDDFGTGLVYSTFFGGNGDDVGNGIVADAAGNAYVAGSTTSTLGFPLAAAMQSAKAGGVDGFVAKLDALGVTLVFSTYLGGTVDDDALALALGPDLSVFVTGVTSSTNFPLLGPLQSVKGLGDDAFITKLNAAGTALAYSTFLGGAAADSGNGIAVHSDGSAYVTGSTRSVDFPVVLPIQPALGGGSDAFVAKVDAGGAVLVYSTYLGAAGDDVGNGIALDPSGSAYVIGSTASAAFPTFGGFQTSPAGGTDVFVAQVSDGGIVEFSGATYSVAETTATATITVTRTGDASAGVTVDFATSNGTATAGGDYTATSGTLTFAPGETSRTFVVPILDDAVGDGDETVNLTLSNVTGGASIGARGTAVLTIRDNERSVNFTAPVYTVTEGAPSVTITVARSGPTTGSITVRFSTADGTALAGQDYSSTAGTLTFPDGVTTRSFTVPILNDNLAEGTETVNLTLFNVTGGALLGVRDTAVVNILDNDAGGVLQFSAATYAVSETTSTATITVTRTSGIAAGVTVDFTTSDGTATAGADYTTAAGTLTFAAGVASRTFTIPITNDTASEGSETVNLTLSNATGGAVIGTRATAELTITDDEPTIAFSTDAFTAAEGGGAATITVRRSGSTAGSVTVDFTTSDGSATGGVDYTPASGTLTFGAGVSVRTFTVPIAGDTLVEGSETVVLTLTNATGGVAVVTPSVATLTITDDDVAGTVEFSAPVYTTLENAGTAVITVTRAGGTASGVTVDFATTDGTAGGLDYGGTAGTLSFAAGETSKTFAISILDDALGEGVETVNLRLSTPRGGAVLGLRTTAVLRIVDDEPTLQFTAATYTTAEGAGSATITVERTGTAGTVSVNYSTSSASATATAGLDYQTTRGTLLFGPGIVSQAFSVPILQDTLAEGEETFSLVLSNATGAFLAPRNTAVVSITDDDVAGSLQFSGAVFSVSETGGTATVTVTRRGGSASNVSVGYATADGTATAGADYTAVSGRLTFGFNEMSRTFTVPILNDSVGEANETITLSLSAPGGGGSLATPSTALLNIVDDEPTVRLSSATYSVGEGAGFANITVERGGIATGARAVTVDYMTTDGTAVAGVDYTPVAGRLTFATGVTAATISVPLLNDTLVEPAETITLTLSNPTNAVLVSPSAGEITITDNDLGGKLQFGAPVYSVNENGGEAVITVTRIDGGASGVTVTFSTGDGPAPSGASGGSNPAVGVDYLARSGTLTFGPGETSRTLIVPIVDDGLAEGTETVILTLSAPTGGATLGTPLTTVLRIVDNEETVQFTDVVFTGSEGAPVATITVERTGTTGGVTVNYRTSNGSGLAGTNYTATSGTLTFAAGETTASFTVPLLNNTRVEANKTVNLALSGPSGAVLGPRATAILTVEEDDRGGTFAVLANSVLENAGIAVITVQRTGGTAGPVTVNYSTAPCSLPCVSPATPPPGSPPDNPAHFTRVSGTLTFAAGELTKTFVVPVLDNAIAQGLRYVDLMLSNAQPAGLPTSPVIGSTLALLEIVEDELHFIRLSADAYTVNEGVGAATITVLRTGTVAALATTATVQFGTDTFGGATAVQGQDYTAVSGVLTFGPNVTTRTFTIPIIDDTLVDGLKTLNVFIHSATGGAGIVIPALALLTINDNDVAGSVQFALPAFSADENSGLATITVTRTGGLASGVTVAYATSDGGPPTGATGGVDYTGTSGVLTFAAGETSRTFTVPIIDDALSEGAETLTLTLTSPGGGATMGTPATAPLSIVDNEATVRLSAATYSVTEAGGTAAVTVERTGNLATPVTVAYAVGGGSATASQDYLPTSGVLSFGAGVSSRSFAVPIVNDTLAEGSETLNVTLSAPSGATVVFPGTAVLTITDDDLAGTMQFSASDFTVDEAAGTVTITVTRSGGDASGVTVRFATADGTATAGADYTARVGTLTFAAGQTSRTFVVPITADADAEGPETLVLTLSAPGGGGTIGAPGSATLTIVDDEPTLRFLSPTFIADEDAGSARITVVRGGPATSTVTVDYATSNGTATAGLDYTQTSGRLTFGAGVLTRTITVPVQNDTLAEGDETVVVTLSNAAGGAGIAPPATALLTIKDDDVAGTVQFSAATYRVNEDAGQAVITVTRTGGMASAAAVTYAATDSSATAADYTAVTGTLVFGAGQSTASFVVPILDDAVGEENEVITLTLSAPTGGLVLGAPVVASLTIVDNEQTVKLGAGSFSVTENAAVATIAVQRMGTLAGTVIVSYATSDGTAAAGSDYTAVSGQLTFAPGVSEQSFAVPIVNNLRVEGEEIFNVTLSAPVRATLLPPVTAPVSITDDDLGGTVFFRSSLTVDENAGSVTVEVVRVGGAASGVFVDYVTNDGSASAGSDYTAAFGTLTFGAGETSKTITIPIADDAVAEGAETFAVLLVGARPAGFLNSPVVDPTASMATVTIRDNETTVGFARRFFEVNEQAGTAVIAVTRTGSLSATVTVNYTTGIDTATAGADYTPVSGTLTFGPGVTTQTFPVPILDDTILEADVELVALTLSGAVGASLVSPDASLGINDNEVGGTFQLSAATYSVSEGGGSAVITVTRAGGAASGVTVRFATSNGAAPTGATAGSDYNARTGTLTFGPGVISTTFTVAIINDGVGEGPETLNISLSDPQPAGFGDRSPLLGSPVDAVLTILDDDGWVRFSEATYSATEDAGTVNIIVQRGGNTAVTTTVDYATVAGTATAGVDYTTTAGTLTFAPGVTSQSFTVAILDNDSIENDETVQLTLGAATNATIIRAPPAVTAGTAILTIANDDLGGTLRFSDPVFEHSEDGVTATITVTRTGGAARGVLVDFATSDPAAGPGVAPATAGADYTASSGTLSFGAGVVSQTFTVPLLADTAMEGPETVTLTLSNPRPLGFAGSPTLGTPNPATLRIIDGDRAVQFAAARFTVGESDGAAIITVLRTGNRLGTVTVDYATSNGTARPSDYTATSGTLTFAPGVLTQTFSIPVLPDGRAEGERTVNLALSNPSQAIVLAPGTPAAPAVLSIVDDDVAGTVQFSDPTYTVFESGGSAVITVTRTGGSASGVTVDYSTANDTAGALDYTATSGTLNFGVGVTTRTFTVPVVADTAAEGVETVRLQLTNVGGGASIGEPSTASLRIVDDEATLRFDSANYSVDEHAGAAVITVLRSGALATTVRVTYATGDGTARAGSDYTARTGTLTFDPGVGSASFTVPVTDDTVAEGPQTVMLTLSGATGGAVIVGSGLGASPAVLTIVDNDAGGSVQLSSVSYTVEESTPEVTLTVTRTGGAASGVTVRYDTADRTATAGLDYTGVSGVLSFGAGETSKTFVVPILDDTRAEGAQSFIVSLSSVTGGATLGTPNAGSVTIFDDERTVGFGRTSYAASEGGGVAFVDVMKTGPGTVTVDYSTVAGTATAAADFTPVTGTLTFGPGTGVQSFAVTLNDDSLAEGEETVLLVLSSATAGAAIVRPEATLVIDDDDFGGVVRFSAPTYSVSEGAGTAVITVTRTGGAAGNVTVGYATSDGTATAGADYTTRSGTLTFAAGQTSRTFAVSILTDTLGEGVETVNLALTGVAGGASIGAGSAVLQIIDEEQAFQFSAPTYTVSEAGAAVTITVQRSGTTGPATVGYSTADGTALAGRDYIATAGTLSFTAGVAAATFSVPILNNTVVAGDRTVALALGNPTGGTLAPRNTAVLTITEDDVAGVLQFSAATYSVREDGGAITITVTRSGGAASGVSVRYATSDGTAYAGVDYLPASGDLTFGAGQSSATFTVSVLDDVLAEAPETVMLTLSAPTGGGSVGGNATATLQIRDDESRVEFSSAGYTINEGVALAAITLLRTGDTTRTVSVDVVTGAGTATAGLDYATTTATATFGPGEVVQIVSIPIVNDTIVEPDETVTLTLANPVPANRVLITGPAAATLTILDNDLGGTMQFSATTYSVAEGAPRATITVTRVGGAASGTTVRYETSNGTASAPGDYTARSAMLTFGAGETSKTFTVPIIADTIGEGDETLTLILSSAGGGGAIGEPSTAVLTILDDDNSLGFSAPSYTVTENGGSATITVVRTGGAGTLSVGYATSGGTATAGSDYAAVSGRLTFGPGVMSQTFDVPIVNNTRVEGDETITLALSSPTGLPMSAVTAPFATVTIVDEDVAGAVEFSAASYTVDEAAGTATITVTRAGGSASGVTVAFATSDGTATAPADYTATTGTLTFGAGQLTATFSVPIIDDTVKDDPDPLTNIPQTVNLTLSNPRGGAVLGLRTTAVLSIIDNEPVLRFTSPTYVVTENAGTATVTVERIGSLAGQVTVQYATSDAGADAGADYTAVSGTLTFAAGVATRSFTVPILDDTIAEGSQAIGLTLRNPQPAARASLSTPPTATLTILDNDQAGTIQFTASAYSVGEAAGSATITVSRTNGAASAVTVDYTTLDGTARAPGDYASRSGTLTFAAGQTSRTFTVPIVNDGRGEGDETVVVVLSNPGGGGSLAPPSQATLTIVDNEPTIRFSLASYVAVENAGTVTITVMRDGSSAGQATVDYRTTNGTADAGSDYAARVGTLTFATGVTSRTFAIPVTDDARVEGNETINLTLSNAAGATLVTPAAAVLTVIDNDLAGTVEFSAATYAVVETGAAVITVTRTGGLAEGVTVQFATRDGSPPNGASAGLDYTANFGTLTFGANQTTATFSVPILGDAIAEGGETVLLSLTNPGGGAILGVRDTAVLTITDNDVAGVVEFDAPVFSVSETGLTATITVRRSGGAAGGVSVSWATSDGPAPTGATAGVDYTAASGTVNFGAGATTRTFTVAVADDAVAEGVEGVLLTLSNPRGGAVLGPQSTATLRIVDNESAVQFAGPGFSVRERDGSGQLTVERTGSTGTVTVQYATVAGGTATANTDYTRRTGTLTFGPGVTTLTISVPILDDNTDEGDETIAVRLSNATGAVLGPQRNAMLTIVEDDHGGVVQFDPPTYSTTEGRPEITLFVRRSGGGATPVTVDFVTVDGTAVAGVDFAATTGTLSFSSDGSLVSFTVPLLNDTVVRGTRAFSVELRNPTGGATVGAAGIASVNLAEDDKGGIVEFSSATYSVVESRASATITLTRTRGEASGVSVRVSSSDGTATAGIDYTAINTTVVFGVGQLTQTVTVPLTTPENTVDEPNRTVNLLLSSPTGGAIIGPGSTAVLTIQDND